MTQKKKKTQQNRRHLWMKAYKILTVKVVVSAFTPVFNKKKTRFESPPNCLKRTKKRLVIKACLKVID